MNGERWYPERAGVVNIWRYLEETFEFHAGRLLLRGPNGSGKSMALELLFPFLLDANAQPSRLSSSTRSRGGLLERLLTGSEHSSRAGFLWADAFENPSILAQAARGRWTGPPLLCTSGWPNVAALTLIRQVKACGVAVRYHGDFDPKGIAIAEMLVQRVGVDPWRMSTADYVARAGAARVRLDGDVPDASWDPNLADAMRKHGVAVFEENMREELLMACHPQTARRAIVRSD
jgi:hypothetical protein